MVFWGITLVMVIIARLLSAVSTSERSGTFNLPAILGIAYRVPSSCFRGVSFPIFLQFLVKVVTDIWTTKVRLAGRTLTPFFVASLLGGFSRRAGAIEMFFFSALLIGKSCNTLSVATLCALMSTAVCTPIIFLKLIEWLALSTDCASSIFFHKHLVLRGTVQLKIGGCNG